VIAALLALHLVAAAPPQEECVRQPDVETWIVRQRPLWESRLSREPGYEAPVSPQACALNKRRPYSDPDANRLWVAPIANVNDQVSVIHEYLHLALRHHPHSRDEAYVENLARELVEDDD
jgi:uncharacterized protein YfaQ (DUF2300 family)